MLARPRSFASFARCKLIGDKGSSFLFLIDHLSDRRNTTSGGRPAANLPNKTTFFGMPCQSPDPPRDKWQSTFVSEHVSFVSES